MAARLKIISLVSGVGGLTKLSVGREKCQRRWQLGAMIGQTESFCTFSAPGAVVPSPKSGLFCDLTILNVIFAFSSLTPDLPKVKWHQVYQLQKCQRPDIHVCHVRAVCPPTRWTPAQQGFLHPRSGLYAEVSQSASQTFNTSSFRFPVLWHPSQLMHFKRAVSPTDALRFVITEALHSFHETVWFIKVQFDKMMALDAILQAYDAKNLNVSLHLFPVWRQENLTVKYNYT